LWEREETHNLCSEKFTLSAKLDDPPFLAFKMIRGESRFSCVLSRHHYTRYASSIWEIRVIVTPQ
jgi:hypothetical protein